VLAESCTALPVLMRCVESGMCIVLSDLLLQVFIPDIVEDLIMTLSCVFG
jgi:hypothetical protein